MTIPLSRREFIKTGVAAAAAGTLGLPLPAGAAEPGATADSRAGWRWDKGVCRFCGVGCGILIATEGGRVVAVKGDRDTPVNRGLHCVKGYSNAKILYGEDRLTQPLLRMKDGKFDKQGEFVAGLLGAGLRRDGAPVQARPRRAGASRRRDHGLGPVHGPGGLCCGQAA